MQTDIRYPIRFGAQPTTTDRYKVVLCSYLHSHNAPSITSGEARAVLDMDVDVTKNRQIRLKLVDFENRLFRKVCDQTDFPGHASLSDAFECTPDRNTPHHPLVWCDQRPGEWNRSSRPLGTGLWNRIAHRLYIDGAGREKEAYAWPNAPFNLSLALRWNRNDFKFENYLSRMTNIDADEFSEGVAQIVNEADRLLCIDDELWLETPPLVYEVGHGLRSSSGHIACDYNDLRSKDGDLNANITIQLAYLPDWLDTNLDRQYFPLSARDKAVEYAAAANPHLIGYASRRVIDHTRDIPLSGLSDNAGLLEFDHAAYSLNRTTMLLAGDLTKSLKLKPNLNLELTDVHQTAIATAADQARRLGWRSSDWSPVHHDAATVVDAWSRTGRGKGWAQLPVNRSAFAELLCQRTLELFDEMPVMVPTGNREPAL